MALWGSRVRISYAPPKMKPSIDKLDRWFSLCQRPSKSRLFKHRRLPSYQFLMARKGHRCFRWDLNAPCLGGCISGKSSNLHTLFGQRCSKSTILLWGHFGCPIQRTTLMSIYEMTMGFVRLTCLPILVPAPALVEK